MKRLLFLLIITTITKCVTASDNDSTLYYQLPDSVKAVSFFAEIKVQSAISRREAAVGIKTDQVSLYLTADKKEKEIVFEFPAAAIVMATGKDVELDEPGELEWDYNWTVNESYKLLIAVATDSAENFSLYSGYIFLPIESKWKLIGTCKVSGQWTTIKQPGFFFTTHKKNAVIATTSQVWCQRNNSFWKNLSVGEDKAPVINLLSHIDSSYQLQTEIKEIENAITKGSTDAKQHTAENIYHTLLKEGGGASITADDTVVIYYKGYLFKDGTVFDQTKEKPATFPLRRLIKGWQIGVPLCKVGGKIKLVIPSAMAYSIRTRAAKIPPNSILVFEIEVLEVKPVK